MEDLETKVGFPESILLLVLYSTTKYAKMGIDWL